MESNCAMFCIAKDGIIMSAENTKSSFGYEGDFLCGKPIDIILSQPYREHNSAFGTTPLNDESGESHGKSTDLSFAGQLETLDGKSVMQEGQHKDLASEPFPIRLSISNVGDGMFMVLVDEFKEMCTSITMDVKGNIKSSVKLLEEMFGYDLDYIKTCNVSTLFPPEIQEVGQPPPLESDSEDQLVVRNLIGRHKNGSRFYCTMQLKATRAMGRLVLYLGNLTKLDPTLEALVILDVKEHILSYSQSYFNSLFGYKKDELVGMNMKSIITRKKRERNNSSMNVQRKRKSREEGVGGNDNNSGEKRSKKRSPSVSTDSAQKTSPPAGVSAVIKSTEESIVPQRHVDTSGTLHMKHKDGSQVPIHLEMIPFQNGEGEWRICMKIKRVALKEKPKEKEKREKYLGPWLMMDLLGEGVSGKVMSAKHRETGQTVAIKTIQKRKLDGPEIERTKREVKIMSKLSHENIIKLYDVIETDHKLNIVMELIDPSQGSDLMDYITKRDHLSEEESKGLFRQILASIHHCHKDGIVHRDIKHKNIMVTNDKKIKLIDFGLSNFLSDGKMGATICGSHGYTAPEMLLGQKYVGSLVDVWSLGVVLYLMLTGKFPFDGISEILAGTYNSPDGVSESCRDFLKKMLVVKPEERSHLTGVMSHPWIQG